MALQDLTPQLRTRLSRMERAVGWFVIFAAALLAFGFIYYVYNTAERKGWFKTKAPYFTFVETANGIKEGDPVRLMGFDVGQIKKIETMPGDDFERNIYLEFEIKDPYYDYLWTEGSHATVASAGLLEKRVLEVTKGSGGHPIYEFYPLQKTTVANLRGLPEFEKWLLAQDVYDSTGTNLLLAAERGVSTNLAVLERLGLKEVRVFDARKGQRKKSITAIWQDEKHWYEAYLAKTTKPYWLKSEESPAVTERLENLITDVEKALPGIFALTNQLAGALSNTASLASNISDVAISARPAISNIAAATANLDHPGALGEWLLPTNISAHLEGTLGSAEGTFQSANSNLTILVENLARSLDNLAGITSNLNNQVQSNTNLLGGVSQTFADTDDLVQGLKKHWLFRSAFKKKKETNAPPATVKKQKAPGK